MAENTEKHSSTVAPTLFVRSGKQVTNVGASEHRLMTDPTTDLLYVTPDKSLQSTLPSSGPEPAQMSDSQECVPSLSDNAS